MYLNRMRIMTTNNPPSVDLRRITIMKIYILIITLLAANLFAAPLKKDVYVYFNPAKLTSELKDGATLFKYKSPNCKYVVHEPGAPVLPSVMVYVLMPKGAVFKSCSVRAEAQPLCGNFKLYCRRYVAETAFTAKRYPPKLAEFVGCKKINGYRTFAFRTYPITCQPGDNSVNRILKTSLLIKYDVPEESGLYECLSSTALDKVKHSVVNPDDLDRLTSSYYAKSPLKRNSVSKMEDELIRDFFATEIKRDNSNRKPDIAVTPKRSSFDKTVEENLFIDDNDIVYAPITF